MTTTGTLPTDRHPAHEGRNYPSLMARKVHLHICTMKSGTTFLQQLCTEHRERLLESGVLWPISARYQVVRDLFGWPWEGVRRLERLV